MAYLPNIQLPFVRRIRRDVLAIVRKAARRDRLAVGLDCLKRTQNQARSSCLPIVEDLFLAHSLQPSPYSTLSSPESTHDLTWAFPTFNS